MVRPCPSGALLSAVDGAGQVADAALRAARRRTSVPRTVGGAAGAGCVGSAPRLALGRPGGRGGRLLPAGRPAGADGLAGLLLQVQGRDILVHVAEELVDLA